MEERYFDTCVLVKLYINESDSGPVRAFARTTGQLVSSAIAAAEFASAVHRHLRVGGLDAAVAEAACAQFAADREAGIVRLIPLQSMTLALVEQVYQRLPLDLPLRAADAIHLATAAEAGFTQIHSSDARLLKAAPRFRLKGVDPTR